MILKVINLQLQSVQTCDHRCHQSQCSQSITGNGHVDVDLLDSCAVAVKLLLHSRQITEFPYSEPLKAGSLHLGS